MLHVRHFLGDVHIGVGCRLKRGSRRGAGPQQLREGLETTLARDHGARAALGLVREIEILERLLGVGGIDARFQRVVELALFFDALENRDAAFAELAEVLRAIANIAELNFVETAGGFLTVAGDEWKGVAFVEERERSGDLLRGERE